MPKSKEIVPFIMLAIFFIVFERKRVDCLLSDYYDNAKIRFSYETSKRCAIIV